MTLSIYSPVRAANGASPQASVLHGKRAAMLLFSYYPSDVRPRRAAEALVGAGMTVDLICLRRTNDEPTRETFNGVDILRVPLRRNRRGPLAYVLWYSTFILSTFGFLAARSLRRRYDLVYVNNMPDVLVFSALVPKLLGAKVILDLHDPMPELMMTIFGLGPTSTAVRTLKRLERWSIAFADRVLTVNRACKNIFGQRSCSPEKIAVVMNSPDNAIFALRRPAVPAEHSNGRRFVLMYHGSILERNGLDLAIEALAAIRPSLPGVELRIYGDTTPFLNLVMEKIRASGVQDAVRYLGPKRPEEIVAAIDECDAGIIPNRRNIFTELNTPTRIFEYLSRGKPVITGRAPGVTDYFADDALFFFELGNPTDLARVVAHVAADPLEADRVVERGQKVYLEHRWSDERRVLVDFTADLFAPEPRRHG